MRGENTWLGDFDKDGNFLPDPRFPPNYGRSAVSGTIPFVWAFGGQKLVYEHRSGRVIKGTMLADLGSTVLDIKDVDLKKPDRNVWNMPEVTPAYVEERKRRYGDNAVPDAPEPPKAGTPPGYEFKLFRELATDKKAPVVIRVIGEVMEFGRLSDEGEFVPESELPPLPPVLLPRTHTHPPIYAPTFDPYYTLPRFVGKEATAPKPRILGIPDDLPRKVAEKEDVYEYRSRRLIKGTLEKTGNFVPEVGSKVIDFKDFDPLAERRRIYNLPGVLRKAQ
jgi:hypothetical protein